MTAKDETGAKDVAPEEPPSTESPRGPSLAARAAGSGVWSVIGQVVQMVLGTFSFALLSRWLTPVDYGILGMASTVTGFLGVVGDSGITNAVMRLPKIDDEAESTAFWLSVMGGGTLTLVAACASPILAWFYKEPAITWVAVVLAGMFFLGAPMRVSTARLSRELRFRALTIIGIVTNASSAAVAITCAMNGFGVWSLVAQTGTSYVVQTVLTIALAPPKIGLRLWSRARARELAGVGSRLSGFSLSVTVGRALDMVLAGRVLGAEAPGLMTMGLKLVFSPIDRLSGVFYQVFLPASVELNDDARQSRAFVSTLRLLMIVVGPFSLGAVAIAPEIVALLPARWSELTPILRLYSISSLAMPASYLAMSVLISRGGATTLLRMGIAMVPVNWAAAIFGALWGTVVAMTAAWAGSIIIASAVAVWLIWRPLGLGRTFWSALLTPVAASAIMAIGVRMSLTLLGLSGTRIGFIVGVSLGAVFYGTLAWLMMRADLVRAAQLLVESVRRRRGSPKAA